MRLPESVDVGGDDELGGVGAEDGVVRVPREQSADREVGAGRKRGADRVRDVGEGRSVGVVERSSDNQPNPRHVPGLGLLA